VQCSIEENVGTERRERRGRRTYNAYRRSLCFDPTAAKMKLSPLSPLSRGVSVVVGDDNEELKRRARACLGCLTVW